MEFPKTSPLLFSTLLPHLGTRPAVGIGVGGKGARPGGVYGGASHVECQFLNILLCQCRLF